VAVFDSPRLGPIHYHDGLDAELALMHREVVEEDVYLRHGVELAPGMRVVDAGANIGLFSRHLLALVPELHIVAIEPVPSTFALLRANLGERARLHSVALGGRPGTTRLTVFPRLPTNSTLDPEAKRAELMAWIERSVERLGPARRFLEAGVRAELEPLLAAETVEVEVVPLVALVESDIDLLKIDVEGAELAVLEGAPLERVRQVVVETSGPARATELAERLRHAGFARVHVEQPAWADALGVANEHVYATR